MSLGLSLQSQSYNLTNSDFTITGTSNLHDWESEVTQVNWSGNFTFSEGGLESINNVRVTIPVTGIESSKGRIMDKKTHEALNSDKHPRITFTMSSCVLRKSGDHMLATAKGQLTVAGASRTVAIPVRIDQLANGQIKATGDYNLRMTDYGIDPPTALLGTLTTGDEVGLHFKLTFSPQ